ncbi:hypothetical protein ACIQBJ_03470 [Kitasatospora sp. NPDC088391]|uniref:hypothetical protein n=1 Tax=Kitasatospora sp. NPDC088391 TaxID=3364074 RepID=UPI0037F57B4D
MTFPPSAADPARRRRLATALGLLCAGLLAGTLLSLDVRPAAPPPPDRTPAEHR